MTTRGRRTTVQFRASIARFRRSLAATLAFAIMLPTIALNAGVALAAVPVSFPDEYVAAEGALLAVGDEESSGVLDNDQADEAVVVELVSGPANAAEFELSETGAFRYIPEADFVGVDSFSYRAVSATGAGAPTPVTITVEASLESAPIEEATAVAAADSEMPFEATDDGDEFTAKARGYNVLIADGEADLTVGSSSHTIHMGFAGGSEAPATDVGQPTLSAAAPAARSSLTYYDIYPEIDVVYSSDGKELEYGFVIHPGGDPDDIAVEFDGVRGVEVDDDGTLLVDSIAGRNLTATAPYAYQEVGGSRVTVASHYVISDEGSVAFAVGGYDPGLPLIIDPTFKAVETATENTTSLTVAVPTGVAAGDFLVAQIFAAAGSVAFTPPAGWTAIREDDSAVDTVAQALFYRVASSSEPADYTFTFDKSVKSAGAIAVFTDVDTANPIDAHDGQVSASGDPIAPSITTTVADTRLVALFGQVGSPGFVAPSGMTKRWDVGTDPSASGADEDFTPIGATGTRTATGSGGSQGIAQMVALTPAPLPDLRGDWRFEEPSGTVAIDSSSLGNDGTYDAPASRGAGVVSTGLDLTGTDDWVIVPDPVDGSLDFGSGDFTISLWVRSTQVPASGAYPELIYKRTDGASSTGFEMYLIETEANRLAFDLHDNGSTVLTRGTPIADGLWHHVAAVRGSSAVVLYIDGVQVDSAVDTLGDISNSRDLFFGRDELAYAWSEFDGNLDEVKIYGQALTPGEIAAISSTVPNAISGTVFEDVVGDALNDGAVGDTANPGAENVDVYLYLDDGDANLDADDTLIGGAPTQTAADGAYSFTGLADGDYFVVVDSKTVAAAQDAAAVQTEIWAEQTYGPTGAYCDNGIGYSIHASAGPCYGGIAGHLSDDFSQWDDREHRAAITVSGSSVLDVDFGFSFNVVVNTTGGGTEDWDPLTNRTVQGSLRQFIQNANAIDGPNAMRFVPVDPAGATDGTNYWWRVMVTRTLPTISGDGTTIDGRAFDFADGATILDTNVAQIGAGVAVGTEGTYTTPQLDPELEIRNYRPTAVVPTGLVFEASDGVLRHVSIWGFGDSSTSFDANVRFGTTFNTDPDFTGSLVEFNVIGTGPASFTDPGVDDRTGLINLAMRETDNAIVRDNLIGFAGGSGVSFNTSATSGTVLRNEVRRNGILNTTGNPVGVWMSGRVTGNLITDNASGIYSGPTLAITYQDNTVSANGWGATRPDGIWVSGSFVTIQRNVIADNVGAGVVVPSSTDDAYVTRNSFFGNGTVSGQVGIDLLATGDDPLVSPYVTLNDDGDVDAGGNGLLNSPVIEDVSIQGSDLAVSGWARPGSNIEFYLADLDPTGFGEGQKWLITQAEGSVGDLDTSTGTYGPGTVNGIAQGTDTTERFEFEIPLASLSTVVSASDRITAVATIGTATSEFSGAVAIRGPIVVNSTGDDIDFDRLDGICSTGATILGGDPECTLRAAIEVANDTPGVDSISFNIPTTDTRYSPSPVSFTIKPDTLLPAISTPMVIDASTQPQHAAQGRPVVVLTGGNVTVGELNGFHVTGGGSTIRGFVVNNWGDDGIDIEFAGSNSVVGNYVGTDPTGMVAVPNAWGINAKTGSNTFGGTDPADRNVVSGNTYDGFYIYTTDAIGNEVLGNYVGVDAVGTDVVPNGRHGVFLFQGANGNTVGGAEAGAGNVISGSGEFGVNINGIGTDSNDVIGNYIGTDAAGTDAAGIPEFGNSYDGVVIRDGAQRNTIGGTTPSERNIIAGNKNDGVWITGTGTDENTVQGNWIGYGADGSNLGNDYHGVAVEYEASNNLVGGLAAGAGNRIGNSGWDGVNISGGTGVNNSVLGNEISGNGELGIDLADDGVNLNDPFDADTNVPNDLLNFPVIDTASEVGGTVTVKGTFDVPAGWYRVEFFDSAVDDSSGHGEGETLVGSASLEHTVIGDEPFGASFPGSVGDIITATLTECTDSSCTDFDSTSEFSAAVKAEQGAFVVNSTGDGSDDDTDNGVCDTGATILGGAVECTLRAAIEQANVNAGTDAIHFSIPTDDAGYSASPLSYAIQVGVPGGWILPAITDPVIIDGGTQPGFSGTPVIVVDGAAAVNSPDTDPNGLTLQAGSSTINGLAIVNFGDDALEIEVNGGNTITGSYFGIGVDGSTPQPNGYGVSVKSNGNRFGGTEAGDQNVISGNSNYGIAIYESGSGNVVQGNYIGVTANGSLAIGNGERGIEITDGASNNTIGGTVPGAGNVISGNTGDGLFVGGAGTSANVIQGNAIGLGSDGTTVVANGGDGIEVGFDVGAHTIGGSNAGAGNVISGNGGNGIYSFGAGSITVEGNTIGLDAAGGADRGNTTWGIRFRGDDWVVGGNNAGARNVISGNDGGGIFLDSVSGVTVQGNYIGTNASGTAAVGNSGLGILASGAHTTLIGGALPGRGNVISGNTSDGIQVGSSSTTITIQGNSIGASADGSSGIPNIWNGVSLYGVGSLVGGDGVGEGNLIRSNARGVTVSGAGADSNTILGNSIFSNTQLGIDLNGDGVTANESEPFPPGPNGLLNYPEIATAYESGGIVTLSGTFDVPAGAYRFEFFDNAAADPTGYGEGQTLVGSTPLTHTGSGDEGFGAAFPGSVGDIITATLTECTDVGCTDFESTSEFSAAITVTVNLPPVATDDPPAGTFQVSQGSYIGVSVMSNDSDPNGDTLYLDSFTQPSIGTVTLMDGGTPLDRSDDGVRYDAPAASSGATSFTYTISDGLLTDTATVFINVPAPNVRPTAVDDSATTPEDTLVTIDVLANDSDSDGTLDPSSVIVTAGPSNGGIFVDTDGSIDYTPALNFFGADTFTYEVCDDDAACDTADVTVTVTAVNDAPALALIGGQGVDELVELTFTASATDPDTGDSLSFSLAGVVPTGASIDPTTGVFSWTPSEAQGPGVYLFDVVVTDNGAPILSDSESISVTVDEVNVAPALASVGNRTVDELVELTFTASATDADVPVQALAFSLVGAPTGAAITAGGLFSWTPTEAQGPGTYSFDVVVSDGVATDVETISVTVGEANVAPVLATVGNQTVDELVELTFAASASDVDVPGQTLSFSLSGQPAGASITAGGVFSWTASEAQGPGSYTFDVVVSDGALSDSETITVTVDEVNVPPVLASIGNQTVDELVELTFTATATDVDDPVQTLTFSLSGEPTGAAITAGGDFSWTPTEGQGPADYTFDVVVSDGVTTSLETITVSVGDVNTPPVLAPIGPQTVDELVALAFTATASDLDDPVQTLTFSLSGTPVGAAITAGGLFSWTPTEAQGPGSYTFDVVVSDGVVSDSETITVTVDEVNVAPVLAAIGPRSVGELVALAFTASATDVDLPAQTLAFSLSGSVPAGAAITAGGVFSWTPTEAQGPADYTFDVVVSDGVTTDSETITVTVDEVNAAPVMTLIGPQSTDELVELTFNATATDVDIPVQALVLSLAGEPVGAAITAGGLFTWTPTEAQGPGSYTFDVVVSDGVTTGVETISVTVGDVNTPPVLAPIGPQSVDELIALAFTATASDVDDPAQTLSFTLVGAPVGASITAAGDFTWTPTEAQGPGSYLFDVVVSDGVTTSAETISVTVDEVNAPPVLASIGNQIVDELVELAFTATATDVDLPAQALTFSLVGAPTGAVITAAGDFTWTPTEAQGPGSYSFDVVVSDGVTMASETISVTVGDVNTPPVLSTVGNQGVDELVELAFTATATDADIPAQAVTFSLVGEPAGAAITVGGDFTWTPTEAQGAGVYLFDVVVSDGVTTDVETISVTVREVNAPPVLASVGNQSVDELVELAFTAMATDVDLPAQALTFSLSGEPAGATIDPLTGDFSWTPTEAQGPGGYLFDVVVSDGVTTDVETITVTVDEVNAPPVMTLIGPQSTDELVELAFTANATDADIPVQALVFSLVGEPVGASISTGGDFTWTPTEAQGPGSHTFDVVVSDGVTTASETITVTVSDVNTPPVLAPIGPQTADELVELALTATASDVDLPAQALTFSLVRAPAGAAITVGGDFTWTPSEAQGPGGHSFDVVVSDGVTTASETITVTVDEVNDAPVLASIGNQTVDELVELAFTATATDVDDPAQALDFSLTGEPTGAAITAGGDFTWTPTEAQGPGGYTFDVVVSDGVTTSVETISVTVGEVNDAPVLVPIGNQSVDELVELAFTASATDGDVPAQTLTFSLSGEPAGAAISAGGDFTWTPTEAQGPGNYSFDVVVSDGVTTDVETISVTVDDANTAPVLAPVGDRSVSELVDLSFTASASDGDVPAQLLTFSLSGEPAGATIGAGGLFTWTPSEAQGPGTYTFDVVVSDGVTADAETIAVAVGEANAAPVLAPIGSRTAAELSQVAFTASATDGDVPSQALTFSLASAPAGAAITAGGAFSWTPSEAQGPGTYSFDVVVSDGVTTDVQTIAVTVGEVNAAPTAGVVPDQVVIEEDRVEVTATASDPDVPTQILAWSLVSGPGSVSTAGTYEWATTGADGPAVYTVTLEVSDGVATDRVSFDVAVTEGNMPPVLAPIGGKNVQEMSTLTFTATSTDPNGDTRTYRLDSGSAGAVPSGASINAASGVFTWTPTGAQGPGVYLFDVVVTDNGLPNLSDRETIVVVVPALVIPPIDEPNRAPTAAADFVDVLEDGYVEFAPLTNDSDPEGGPVYLVGWNAPATGSMQVLPGDIFTYRPSTDFNGTVTVTYTVADEQGATNQGTITITVLAVNDAPVAQADSVSVDSYDPVRIAVLANDVDPDGDALQLVSVDQASHGTVQRTDDGDVIYDPDSGWTGEDRFSYAISDGNGGTTSGVVTVSVTDAALRAGKDLMASLGINAAPLFIVEAGDGPISLGLLATEGISLLAASFWQTVLALQVPLVFLLFSLGLVFFTGGAGNVLALIGGRRRYYSAVLLGREDRLLVRQDPDDASEVIYKQLPTARSMYGGGRPKTVNGTKWMPIEIPGVSGWVHAANLVEEMDYDTFLSDKRPARLVADLAEALRSGGDLKNLISPRGLVVALGGDVRLISRDQVDSDRKPGSLVAGLRDQVVGRFLAAYDATQEISPRTAHSSSALLPSQCQNFLYLALEPDSTGSPWLVYIEYRGRNVYISGLGIDV